MSQEKTSVSSKRIEEFLEGSDPQKYIVAVEASFNEPTVTLVINDPESGKYQEDHKFKPFLWFKEDITSVIYNGNRKKILEAGTKYGVRLKKLRTADSNGFSPSRMENGYKYIAICTKSYNSLINYFKEGGIDVFKEEYRTNFVMFSPVEQFMIQTGKRLFKGIDDYDGLHRFQFDLETEGLFASKNGIFQIGVRDNRGMDYLLENDGENYQEKRDSERIMIEKFLSMAKESPYKGMCIAAGSITYGALTFFAKEGNPLNEFSKSFFSLGFTPFSYTAIPQIFSHCAPCAEHLTIV